MVSRGHAPSLPVSILPAHAKSFDVVGVGESSVDLVAVVGSFPTPDSKQSLRRLESMTGGQIATALVGVAKLGGRARYVGALGDDAAAERLMAALSEAGVAIDVVRKPGVPSRQAVILVDEATGSRAVLEHRDERLALETGDLRRDVLTSGRVLLLDGFDAAVTAAATSWAREAGIATVVDVDEMRTGLDTLLGRADVIIGSAAFASASTGIEETGTALRALAREFACGAVVLTLGADGSLALCADCEIRTPGFVVPVVDTTGAGDAFRAGFVAAWLRLGPQAAADRVLEYANATAALNCRQLGAMAGLPSFGEVEALVTGSRHARSK